MSQYYALVCEYCVKASLLYIYHGSNFLSFLFFIRPYCQPVLRVGQVQLLRKHIANELYFSCKLDSNLLCSALDNFNKALVKDIRDHYRNDAKPYPETSNPVMPELVRLVAQPIHLNVDNSVCLCYLTVRFCCCCCCCCLFCSFSRLLFLFV